MHTCLTIVCGEETEIHIFIVEDDQRDFSL
jgi:hypothetical protein